MEMVHAAPQKQALRNWKAQDGIESASFGLGQISDSREDKLDIEFVSGGSKTILKSTELKPAASLSRISSSQSVKGKSRSPRIRVEPAARRPSRSQMLGRLGHVNHKTLLTRCLRAASLTPQVAPVRRQREPISYNLQPRGNSWQR
jgi:hypothetical protein